MTSKEKYQKFYSHPHYWINAIEVECINDMVHYSKGEMVKLTADTLYDSSFAVYLPECKPKFKPQEGEAFIKDLEAAVSAGFGEAKVTHYKTPSSVVFEVDGGELEVWSDLKVTTSSGIAFDTAAYVDKLRELGYYI